MAAAERLREELRAAKQGGYYESGWYSYMRRSDIEKLVYLVLGKEK